MYGRTLGSLEAGRACGDDDAVPASPTMRDIDDDSDVDSLFDELPTNPHPELVIATRSAPLIPGLFFPPVRLPPELEDDIVQKCMEAYFDGRDVNQIMLFGRTATCSGHDKGINGMTDDGLGARLGKGLPPFLISLLHHLSIMLKPWIPDDLYSLLFPPRGAPPRARQAILNLYRPGEGISAHVDLLNRFDDGIIGVSLRSGCVMTFEHVGGPASRPTQLQSPKDMRQCQDGRQLGTDRKRWDLYLPERSILVLSQDARYTWTHAIPGRTHDLVESEDAGEEPRLLGRGTRLSITFRWLLPGADIVGGEPEP